MAQPRLREDWPRKLPEIRRARLGMTADEFYDFCRLNPDWRFEMDGKGGIIVMPPTGGVTGARNLRLGAQLLGWADLDGSGVAFDSSTAFELPNGSVRAPDAAWVRRSQLAVLTARQKDRFIPVCPDFVVELKSPSDYLFTLRKKMAEYIANGAQLGWLIDPEAHRVYVYRPAGRARILNHPKKLSGDPVLCGFTLDLVPIWNPGF